MYPANDVDDYANLSYPHYCSCGSYLENFEEAKSEVTKIDIKAEKTDNST